MNPTRIKRLIRQHETAEERVDALGDELRPLILTLAEACGISSARNISNLELTTSGEDLCVKWYEYWKGDVYDTPTLRFPLRFLSLAPEEFRARIEEVKAETRAHSPTNERYAKEKVQQEADERRRYEQLKAKYDTPAPTNPPQ